MGNACCGSNRRESTDMQLMSGMKDNGIIWIEDEDINSCMGCNVGFSRTNRKHHCRACGRVFCGKCSRWTAVVNNRDDRVCSHCKEYLEKKIEWENIASITKDFNESNFILYKTGMFGIITKTIIHLTLKNNLIFIKDWKSKTLLHRIELNQLAGVLEGSMTDVLRNSNASILTTFTILLRKGVLINLKAPDMETRDSWTRAIRAYLLMERMAVPININIKTQNMLERSKMRERREALKVKYKNR